MTFSNLIRQRRFWATLCAGIAFVLPLFGINAKFEADPIIDAVMMIVDGVFALLAVVLPLLSLIKPKD